MSPLAQRVARLEPGLHIHRPDGSGPHPAILMFHGCGGRKRLQQLWAERFRAAGYAAISVDSYGFRGISRLQAYATVCTGALLRGAERAGDVYAAFAWAQTQAWIDPRRIAIAGWSHGGWTVLDALAMRPAQARAHTRLRDLPDEPLAGLAAAIVIYPYCGFPSIAARQPLRLKPPLLGIVCDQDLITGWREAERLVKHHGGEVEKLCGVTHAFDEPDAYDLRVRFDPNAVAMAEARLLAFLASVMSPALR